MEEETAVGLGTEAGEETEEEAGADQIDQGAEIVAKDQGEATTEVHKGK